MADKTKDLIRLASDNPDLEIITMVDSQMCGDEYSYYLGEIFSVELGEYAIFGDRVFTDREDYKEEYYDQNDEELDEAFGINHRINSYSYANGGFTKEQFDENERRMALLEARLDTFAEKEFQKAIIVYVGER